MNRNRRKAWSKKGYFWIIGVCLIIQLFIYLVKDNTAWVEQYYSRTAYPIIAYLNKFLFSWVPFSVGDIFYFAIILFFILGIGSFLKLFFRKNWSGLIRLTLRFVTILLFIYTFFYVNWGLNYFRQPIAKSIGLDINAITKEDYLAVLEKYIAKANEIRGQLELENISKVGVKEEIEALMRQDTVFEGILSKTQLKIKQPISSDLIAHFTVSGYLNPFTSEVQVNQIIPKPSYPFVNVHELAHQMGIGFEDDCNFIAFRKLVHHDNLWYQYSAYYNAIQSLLKPIYGDKVLMEKYKGLLSEPVKQDLNEEYNFWRSYRSWIDHLSAILYDGYLKHNNQPEGLERYNMMARLIVAWEKQQ